MAFKSLSGEGMALLICMHTHVWLLEIVEEVGIELAWLHTNTVV